MRITFIVWGTPQGKARPRFRSAGRYVQTYTPKKTRDYESEIRAAFLNVAEAVNFRKIETGPVSIRVFAEFEPPKSYSKKKRAAMIGKYHMNKPDGDNILKAVQDALNGYAFTDDAQIVEIYVQKYYGDNPGLLVTVEAKED